MQANFFGEYCVADSRVFAVSLTFGPWQLVNVSKEKWVHGQ